MTERLHVYRGAALPDAFRWQATGFVRTAWPDVDPGGVRDPYPPGLDTTHVTLAEDDVLLAYAGVVRFWILHAGGPWQVFALGRVFTFPAARGAGRGRRVVDRATESIRDSEADLGALLCEPGLRPFYARSGWVEVPPGVLIADGSGAIPYSVPGPTMLLPVSRRAQDDWESFERERLTVPFAW